MKNAYEKIVDELLILFEIYTKDSIEILEIVGDGYSGAEVYIVELKNQSVRKGVFFLKIDEESEEYNKIGRKFCFSKVANCVQRQKIGEYYVLLLQIAGRSGQEYKSFYKENLPQVKQKAVEALVSELLSEAVDKKTLIGEQVFPDRLFRKHLGNKLDSHGKLAEYLHRVLHDPKLEKVSAFQYSDKQLPNAYAYAVNPELWEGYRLRDTACCIHGDLHGNNVFISKKEQKYALIDMSQYNSNGYVFYDMAYFELSILLHNLEREPINEWLYIINCISSEEWENIECKDRGVIQCLVEQELVWIDQLNDAIQFSYMDALREARFVARVLAGLNYAGKRTVNDEIRRKSFLYACCYLEQILLNKKIPCAKAGSVIQRWVDVSMDEKTNHLDSAAFLNFVDCFNESQRYILVLGDNWDYSVEIAENLARVRWTGIISFNREKGFESTISNTKLVRYMEPSDVKTLDLISQNGLWWLYADGVNAKPESQKESYPGWRNSYRRFFEFFSDHLATALTPDDIMLVVDWNSFSRISVNYLRDILIYLDTIENTEVAVALLDANGALDVDEINKKDYINLNIQRFHYSLAGIAKYCSQYLPGTSEVSIYIPSRASSMGVRLDKEDMQFIEQYVTLVHARLIKNDNPAKDKEKYNFYCGEPITWTAIDEQLYVERAQIADYIQEIRKYTGDAGDNENERNQSVISIPHKPGAGASIICRVICWKLKEEYPTLILEHRLNEHVYECFQRLYSISGKHLLILMDGDYDQNDIHQLKVRLVDQRIKACILYVYRNYEDNVDNRMLSTLTYDEGDQFRREYGKKMRELKPYSDEECTKRMENMKKLSADQNMIEFRLPFFYGMHAFEDDYKGINEYLYQILENMGKDIKLQKVVSYMALISYYTVKDGLSFKYAKKICGAHEKSGRWLLKKFKEEFPALIYIYNSSYRLCHPVVAKKILKKLYNCFDSEAYKEFCLKFIEDIRQCEPGNHVSENLYELMMDLFLKRDTEGDMEDNLKKKNFSQIILDISNSNLQEQVFEKLVEVMPDSPYFRQHYGRLIIMNDPELLDKAKEQIDYAIGLDPSNGILYHSRGNMYTKHIIYLANTTYKEEDSMNLYNKLYTYVNEAIEDYKRSIELVKDANNTADLVYPYASIIQTSTYIVNQLINRSDCRKDIQKFMKCNNEMTRWCEELIQTAQMYDMDTECRYDEIRENAFYEKTRHYLLKYRYNQQELEKMIREEPNNVGLKKAYLSNMDSTKEGWAQKTLAEIDNIITYSEDLLRIKDGVSEGVLWKWFNANIHRGHINRSYPKLLGILETITSLEKNLTANYFLMILYFCRFMESNDDKYIEKMQNCIELCRQLCRNGNSRMTTRYYYNGTNETPLAFDRTNAKIFEATVLKIESNQSGYLTLNINPKLRAFFVPIHTELKREQEFNQAVRTKIGFSFDGLRAWEVERCEEK